MNTAKMAYYKSQYKKQSKNFSTEYKKLKLYFKRNIKWMQI